MRILVLGGRGQLGAAITRAFDGYAEVLPFGRADVDITDARQVAALADYRPQVVINCAAYNAVDAAETDPAVAHAINADAVRALARMADAAGAVFVHYSSDFVFDGEGDEPYTERDQPNPISEYGRSKAAGEIAAALAPRHYVLRLASVFGGCRGEGRGGLSTIDRMIDQTIEGRDVVAFADRTVTPSYTHDVAAATRQLLTMNAEPGVYHCVSSEPTTWADLARGIAKALALPSRVQCVSVDAVPAQGARRPRRCALANQKLASIGIVMPTWRDALARHVVVRHTIMTTSGV